MAVSDVNIIHPPLLLSIVKRLISQVCRFTWETSLGDALRAPTMCHYRPRTTPPHTHGKDKHPAYYMSPQPAFDSGHTNTVGTETTFTPSAAQKRLLTPKFKSQRLGANSNVGDAEAGILNFIIDNCPLLTMLEIGVDETPDENNESTPKDGSVIPPLNVKGSLMSDCPAALRSRSLPRNPIYWHALKNIKKLKRLTHLTLCSIPVTNGEFLHEIAIGCPRLKFLRLSNLGPSGKCCYLKDLTESVTLMACLTHLREGATTPAPPSSFRKNGFDG
ncbi:hypothetical protein GWK47_020915 [Chionoecetes opilio]|uniref:Uncharacterized protein n=1 Tax=Chionoecetes opilio TaxID=41210 RepID=A0A8J4XPD3_CHIOP|nr:hypothetical protein GWK47_020915 [Chionoecetes opilio]